MIERVVVEVTRMHGHLKILDNSRNNRDSETATPDRARDLRRSVRCDECGHEKQGHWKVVRNRKPKVSVTHHTKPRPVEGCRISQANSADSAVKT